MLTIMQAAQAHRTAILAEHDTRQDGSLVVSFKSQQEYLHCTKSCVFFPFSMSNMLPDTILISMLAVLSV
jgi:hypothetical protein